MKTLSTKNSEVKFEQDTDKLGKSIEIRKTIQFIGLIERKNGKWVKVKRTNQNFLCSVDMFMMS
jgi:hypothetical protein